VKDSLWAEQRVARWVVREVAHLGSMSADLMHRGLH
jgi:hypothetical protein